jgi:hypothetical protein
MKMVLTPEERRHEEAIREANYNLAGAVRLLEARVIKARRAGMSWNVVARGIGITRQSASARFEKLPELAEDSA